MMNHPTADVEDKDTRTAVEVMRDSMDLYEKKNDDYADSWRLVGKTLALWLEHHDEEELTIPANEYALNSFGLFTRRLDKMLRAFNGWFLTDEMKVSESIVETQEDSVPYAAMHTQLAEEYSKLDFSEFSDEDTR